MKTIESIQFKLPSRYPHPRKILLTDFPSMEFDFPIQGGWGYSVDDAVIIDRDDPVAENYPLFDPVSIEYGFVPKRLYEELIISQNKDNRYSGIEWTLKMQSLLSNQGKDYDLLVFIVTMFADKDWNFLSEDWEKNDFYRNDVAGREKHSRLRDSLQLRMEESFYFDITSCHH